MTERYITCQHAQGSEGWFQDRIGKVTGSRAMAVFAQGSKGTEALTRIDLRMNLVLERVLQKPTAPSFKETESIAWGREQEPHARMAYEMATGRDVEEAGFLYLPRIAAGCSLDGKVVDAGMKGILEIKCPKSKNHYAYILAGVAPTEYVPQMVHNMWITGADFCDFMSFDPRMPKELQEFHIRLMRDEAAIKRHEAGVYQFLMEVDAEEHRMRSLIASRQAIAKAKQTQLETA